jgi:hypothetical protein
VERRGALPFNDRIQVVPMSDEIADGFITLGTCWQLIDTLNQSAQELGQLPHF